MRQGYTEADASTISPETAQMTLERIRASPNFGPFPAPSLNETIMFPGFDGGMEWGGGERADVGRLHQRGAGPQRRADRQWGRRRGSCERRAGHHA